MRTNPKQSAQEDICSKIDRQILIINRLKAETPTCKKAGNPCYSEHLAHIDRMKVILADLVLEESEINQ